VFLFGPGAKPAVAAEVDKTQIRFGSFILSNGGYMFVSNPEP